MDDNNKGFPLTGTLSNSYKPNSGSFEESYSDMKKMDEQVADETSSLGSMPEDVMDIDAAMASVGLRPDTDGNGPTELSDADDLNANVTHE